MANSDKNLVIVPNVGSSSGDPTITFSGADSSLGAQSLQARIYPTSNGTLSFEGSAGQLFSITNSLTGTIYSVNDVSGLPSIEVLDTGVVRLARYSGRVIIGNTTDNGNDSLQFAIGTSISLPNINSTGNVTAIRYTSNVATGTAPFTVSSTTTVTNLSADKVDGIDIGTLTAAGGIAYATSTSALAATGAGTSGQAVISGGAGAPTFQTVASANGASTIVARDAAGSFTGNIITATTFSGSGASLTNIPNSATTASSANGASTIVARDGAGSFTANVVNATTFSGSGSGLTTLNASNLSTGTVPGARGVSSGSTSASFVVYNGTTAAAGQFDGSATQPTGSTRLNYSGDFYPTSINIIGTADTATTATHYMVETGTDGFIRPKTLANARTEIVTSASVYAAGVLAGVATQSFVQYNSTTATAGAFDGGSTTPSGTTRLNYGGNFYATNVNIIGTADTATTATHYMVETGTDGFIRPKTLANAQAEIVTAASVYTRGVTAGTATQSFVQYNSTTATSGAFDGGSTTPSGTTRLNYGGYLYATRYYTSGIYDLTGTTGTPTIYPDVTTGSVSIANGLTTGTLNLGATGVGAKTVNIGTSTGTTVVYGSTVRLPNAGTPGAGKFLQSDASGNATWQTVVSGATISNDTTTNADTFYPGMTNNATSGAWTAATVSSTKFYFNPSTGQLNATNFNSLSDATKKENVKTIESATEKTLALRGVTFDWIDTKKGSLGVIAQEVEEIIPDAVSTSSSGEKSVNYGSLVGLLIETIKEQNARIEALEAIIAAK